MFLHKKELFRPVQVDNPQPRFGQYLLEQFGGATGELTAGCQYFVQSFHVDNPGIKDMLLDIAVEEFGHLEMVGRLIELHTKNVKSNMANDSPLFALRGKRPHFPDTLAVARPPTHINEGGDVLRELLA